MGDDLVMAMHRESGGRLYVHVEGAATLANTFAYWRRIADAVEAHPARELLLVDELAGPALGEDDWSALVAEVGPRLGRLRIAHVKPRGMDTVEYCVLKAMQSGLEANVFQDEHRASVWLRYGGEER